MAAPSPRIPLRIPRSWLIVIVATLLAVHFALAVGSKLRESTTADELLHLTGGVSYWQIHDYRLHPENGILPQRWAALPWWLAGAKFPPLAGNPAWDRSDAWVVGHQFFYEMGVDHFPRLMAGRAMIALFSVATGLLVFVWSRRLFGDGGGLVSLVFFTFCPTLLAHGALATSDVCITFFFLAAAGAWWRHLHDGSGLAWALSALLFGLAFVAKYSAVLLVPMIVIMALVRTFAPTPLALLGRTHATRGGKFGAMALSGLGQGAVAVLVIWAFYGFRYSAFNPTIAPALQFLYPTTEVEARIGLAGGMTHAARVLHLLPEAYLYGFAYVLDSVRMRGAFLNGEYSLTGWPTFFLWTFGLKSTVPLLLGCALTATLALRRWISGDLARLRADCYQVAPLLALLACYWGSSVTSHLNIGHRHLLPVYPALFIGVGALGARYLRGLRIPALLLAGLLVWQVVSAVRTFPHFIAYFNELAGGPENGRHLLVDSSLDWGQDLPALKTWLESHAGRDPVYLSYFGAGEPAYYGLDVRRLAFVDNFKLPVTYQKLEPGIYCISATVLAQVYGPGRGPWTLGLESDYQRLLGLEPSFAGFTRDPQLRAQLTQIAPAEQWRLQIRSFDALRLARLCYYLRLRAPDADAGHSILVYRLNAGEIADATGGPLSAWVALLEKAGSNRK